MSNTVAKKRGCSISADLEWDVMIYQNGTSIFSLDSDRNILSRGVVGVDDYSVISKSISNTPPGGVLVILEGVFFPESTDSIIIDKSINIVGIGSPVIRWEPDSDIPLLHFTGIVKDSWYTCDQDCYEKEKIVKYGVDITASVGREDLLVIRNDNIWDPGDTGKYSSATIAEIHKIKDVYWDGTDTNIVLYDFLIHDYTVADNSDFIIYESPKVCLNGIEFVGEGLYLDYRSLVKLEYCRDSTVSGCVFSKVSSTALSTTRCCNIKISECSFRDMDSPGMGYGVACTVSSNVVIKNCHFENCRHGAVTGGSYQYGQARDIVVIGCSFTSSASPVPSCQPIDSHSGVENFVVINNIVNNTGESGVSTAARQTYVLNNRFYNTGYGVGIRSDVVDRVLVVDGNMFKDCYYIIAAYTPTGVLPGELNISYKIISARNNLCMNLYSSITCNQPVEHITVGNNLFFGEQPGSFAYIRMHSAHAGQTTDGTSIYGNIIDKPGYHGIDILSPCNNNMIENNVILDCNREDIANICYIYMNNLIGSKVYGNIISERVATTNPNTGISSAGNDVIITNNIVSGFSSGNFISDSGNRSVVDNNHIYT